MDDLLTGTQIQAAMETSFFFFPEGNNNLDHSKSNIDVTIYQALF